MQRSNIHLFFYPKPTSKEAISAPIYLRISIDGQRKSFTINRSIMLSDWDGVRQKAKPKCRDAYIINNQIESFRNLVFETHRVLSDQGDYITAEKLWYKLRKPEEAKPDLVNYYLKFIKAKEAQVGIEITSEIVKKHQRIFNKFQAFLIQKKIDLLLFDDMNNEIGKDFFTYLKKNCNLSYNTAVKQMQLFKCVIKDAVNKKYLSRDPFYELKLSVKDSPRPYLIMEEINAISNLEGLMPRLELVKDIFIFSCYTGLAYIDVRQLHGDNVTTGIDGKQWIFTARQKTEVQSNIPLLPKAQEIINKYKKTALLRNGRLLPVLSNQKMNAYLKEIADLIGTKKNLTFHVARHSFATSVTLANGVSIESVSKMLGHKLMRTTQHYAKVVDKRVSDDMMLLGNKMAIL